MAIEHRTTTDFVILKFPLFLSFLVVFLSFCINGFELYSFTPYDIRVPVGLDRMMLDVATFGVLGLLFCKTCK